MGRIRPGQLAMRYDSAEILSFDECRLVTRCRICGDPLIKRHWREQYCSSSCKNRAARRREGIRPRVAEMTPALYELLDELRQAGSAERRRI